MAPHGSAVVVVLDALPSPPGLNLGTYNIRYVRGFALPQAIQAVQIRKYDLMLMTETNILDADY